MTSGEMIGLGIGIANVVISAGIALAVQMLNARTARMTALETDLKNAVNGLIDERLKAVSIQHLADHGGLVRDVNEIRARLIAGESRFLKLEERGHAIEKEVLKEIMNLKDIVATKDDLNRLREEIGR
jgi:hypothetical protein